MSCQEIICIEKIIDIQSTYTILGLKLSSLIEDIIIDCTHENLNFIDIRVLLYMLRNVVFKNEQKALQICNGMALLIKQKAYSKFLIKVNMLKNLILGDYLINGSIIQYADNKMRWDVDVSLILKGKQVTLDYIIRL